MPLPADYHMHTPLCRHATGEPTDYAARAVRLGLPEIGVSDHSPMIRDDYDDWHMRADELDEYVEKVRKARRDHPTLMIKLALEVDYLPGHEGWVRDLAARHPWDYLIGSVHYVTDAWDLDNPKKLDEWRRRDPDEIWAAYFDRLTCAASSGLFDIIGHADLCKRFCFYPRRDCTPLFERFLRACWEHRAAIEVNTSGLRKDCQEIYPSRAILQRAADHGVGITFGSDAHAADEVGMAFADAVALAREAGYTHCCRFTRRDRQVVPF
jgi:histidinol-phosphatase (PHP family)